MILWCGRNDDLQPELVKNRSVTPYNFLNLLMLEHLVNQFSGDLFSHELLDVLAVVEIVKITTPTFQGSNAIFWNLSYLGFSGFHL